MAEEPPPIQIPMSGEQALLAFAKLPPEQAAAMAEALDEEGKLLRAGEITVRIEQAAPDLAVSAEDLTSALLNVISRRERSPAELAAGIRRRRAFRELPELEQDAFSVNLERLVGLRCLRLSARAWDVVTEQERLFAEARILTDVRPVFTRDDEARPEAAVIVDTLRIEYYDVSGDLHVFQVAMDRGDLTSLAATVERGLRKTDNVTDFLASSQLPSWKTD